MIITTTLLLRRFCIYLPRCKTTRFVYGGTCCFPLNATYERFGGADAFFRDGTTAPLIHSTRRTAQRVFIVRHIVSIYTNSDTFFLLPN